MKHFKFFIITMLASIAINSLFAQSSWNSMGTSHGVNAYWKSTNEAKDQYRSEIKLVNNNGYNVDVTIRPTWICSGGQTEKNSSQLISIKAGSTKSGQWAGMIWYPCDGTKPPRECDLFIEVAKQ